MTKRMVSVLTCDLCGSQSEESPKWLRLGLPANRGNFWRADVCPKCQTHRPLGELRTIAPTPEPGNGDDLASYYERDPGAPEPAGEES